ncbi:MAG: hypothetical protein R2700_10720 [Solirubrobacterales bacterium]
MAHHLSRVAGDAQDLGTRATARYYSLASADLEASPRPIDPAFLVRDEPQLSLPMLPMAPVATEDDRAQALYRQLLEDIACTRLQTASEANRLEALAELDSLPVNHRAQVGDFLIEKFGPIANGRDDGVEWQFRRVAGGASGSQMAFAVCSMFNNDIQAAFGAWAQLRHVEFSSRVRHLFEETSHLRGTNYSSARRKARLGHDPLPSGG